MKNTTLKMKTCALAMACSYAVGTNVFAQQQSADAQQKRSQGVSTATGGGSSADGKVDISDLENKYWAPKDTDFSVVQNRTYTKQNRYFISVDYGISVNDSYSSGSIYGLNLNYFFTERHGVQLTYLKANLQPNEAISDLVNNYGSGVYPDHGQMDHYLGVGYDFVPFYAKMSFLGKRIIYFDMAITPTIGLTTYDQLEKDQTPKPTAFTYGFDLTQFFFFSNWFAIRVDWKNQWYTQNVVSYEATNLPTPLAEGASVGNKLIHDSLFLGGLTFYY